MKGFHRASSDEERKCRRVAVFTLENEEIAIKINSRGAELKSLRMLQTEKEYMWHGDSKYWNRTSPILFPFVGGVCDRQYRAKGKNYTMGQHGFARDMEFALLSETDNEIWFRLESTVDTLATYPYGFRLDLGYRIEKKTVTVLWKVSNPETAPLYFSIGGHPAFLCPIDSDKKQTDYFLKIGNGDQIITTKIAEGLATDESAVYELKNGILPITRKMFDEDALVIENNQASEVALLRPDETAYLTVRFQAPLFGIWSPPKKEAPFICIEPWYGRCDHVDFSGSIEDRTWENELAPGALWEEQYTITIA